MCKRSSEVSKGVKKEMWLQYWLANWSSGGGVEYRAKGTYYMQDHDEPASKLHSPILEDRESIVQQEGLPYNIITALEMLEKRKRSVRDSHKSFSTNGGKGLGI